jgi:hypothetical protein
VIVRPNVPEDGPIRSKHVVNIRTYGVSIQDRSNNKTLSYTQCEAGVQHFYIELVSASWKAARAGNVDRRRNRPTLHNVRAKLRLGRE